MKYAWVLIVVAFFCYCGQSGSHGLKEGLKVKIGDSIPSVDLLMLDGATVMNTKSLSKYSSVVFVFFDPYCPFCKKETESIVKSLDDFGKTQFCFLSIASVNDIKVFEKTFNLDQYPNVHIGRDTLASYLSLYRINVVPHTAVYSNHGLKEVFTSAVDAKIILKAIN
ncbi:thioredoxin family protein [Chitinophaga sp. HK235]|uniref:TlpA family protein disulfide reductase n=1 Tax=Chitinophaga sp. HK235 TaxID=2952571 RepID=UPI001BAC73C3|nr:thioredoxin family protein [Chitinophaga sp. HK235]